MKRVKDLQPGDRITVKGVCLTVKTAFDDGQGGVIVECEPISLEERLKLCSAQQKQNEWIDQFKALQWAKEIIGEENKTS